MGHTAFGLADEYPYYAGGNETGHDHHPAGEPSEPNVTTNTDRNTLKWRWAVASSTAIPDDEQSRRATRWTRVRARCRQERSVCSKALITITAARFRPEYDCKMRALSVPFCRICRQVIWNRIGPLATLQARARTPITVVARYPEHLDVFAVANNGRTMSNWWDASSGWAGWFHVQGGIASPGGSGSPVTAIAPLLRASRSLHGRHGQSRLQLLVGCLERLAPMVPDRQSAVSSGLHRQCRQPLHRPSRSLHDRVRRPRHVHVVGRRARAGRTGSR